MRQMQSRARGNGPGLNIYLEESFARDSTNPIGDGDRYLAVIIPYRAIVLLPTEAELEATLPLTVTADDIPDDGGDRDR